MQTAEQMIAAMIEARKNLQDCPFCNAPCDVAVGGDEHGVRYDHRCECLLYLYMEAEPNEYYDDPDDESSNSSQLNHNQSISEAELIQKNDNARATAIAEIMKRYKKIATTVAAQAALTVRCRNARKIRHTNIAAKIVSTLSGHTMSLVKGKSMIALTTRKHGISMTKKGRLCL